MRAARTLGFGAAAALVLTLALPATALPVAPPRPDSARHHGVQLADLFGESDEEKAAREGLHFLGAQGHFEAQSVDAA